MPFNQCSTAGAGAGAVPAVLQIQYGLMPWDPPCCQHLATPNGQRQKGLLCHIQHTNRQTQLQSTCSQPVLSSKQQVSTVGATNSTQPMTTGCQQHPSCSTLPPLQTPNMVHCRSSIHCCASRMAVLPKYHVARILP